MSEQLDARLSVAAVIIIVILLLGQVVLLAAHLWAPLARTADRLIVDEDAPIGGEPPGVSADEQPVRERTPQPSSAWRWVALGLSMLGATLGLFAAWRLYDGTAERNRWMTVLVVAALAIVWGIFTFRLIARSSIIFEGF
ncbi:MAG: hypothetical protein ACOCZ7_03385 [Armatimonadota bacterium]